MGAQEKTFFSKFKYNTLRHFTSIFWLGVLVPPPYIVANPRTPSNVNFSPFLPCIDPEGKKEICM